MRPSYPSHISSIGFLPVIGLSTPLEKLFKEKPDYIGMHNFGCACWSNLHPFNENKLQFHSKQCIFLGYSNLHKEFKCLDVAGGRIYISCDVVFDEIVYPFSKLNPNAGARLRSAILLLPPQAQPHILPNYGAELSDDPSSHVHVIPCSTDVVCSSESIEKMAPNYVGNRQRSVEIQQQEVIRTGTSTVVATV
jgi:hypothetical protein